VTGRLTGGGILLTDPETGRVHKPGYPRPDALVDVLDPEDPRYAPYPSTVVFDVEAGNADDLFRGGPDYVKIAGWADRDGRGLETTDDVDLLVKRLQDADEIVGHNICGFDLLALCRTRGPDWELFSAKARDTLILARLADPPRARDTGGSVDKYDLDHVATGFGLPGKTDGSAALKKQFGSYEAIPNDNPEYHSYLVGDVKASVGVARRLPMTPYGQREHRLASLAGRMTLNGFRVDLPLLAERIREGNDRKADALARLASEHGLPLCRTVMRGRGKNKHPVDEYFASPLATNEAQAWLADVYAVFHVKRPPRTPTGKLSTGSDDLSALARHEQCPPELRDMIELMNVVTQVRTVYQTIEKWLAGDRVHAAISMGQASGRWSVTRPGLTVLGKRGGRHREREVLLPEEGHVLLSCDLSQVDMRGIAGHCQDPAYMAMFEPGRDVHTEIAVAIFGTADMRHEAKARGHGYNYGLGAKAMIRDGADPEKVFAFFRGMEERFPRMIKWRDEIRERGAAGELLDNGFGRMMRCEPERAYTQAPALMGQGSARDIMCESLLRLPDHFRPYLRAMVHDETVVSVPESLAEDVTGELREAFTWEWRGVPILCDISKPGQNFGEISAK
jgi:DNA polymerase-1